MIKYIILGVIQGVSEFLPVSSSGHLVIAQKILNIQQHLVATSVVLHLGTLLAVVIFFRRDILNLFKDLKLFGQLCAVTVITGTIGVLGKDFFESLFSSARIVAIAWVFTGIMLLVTKKFTQLNKDKLQTKDVFILGLAQGLAIIPGVSRSGVTISTLFFRKINRQLAFSVSFLVSIPIILGAALLEARKIESLGQQDIVNLAAGLIFSFIFGMIALLALRSVINKAKFYYFGYYCLFMAGAVLFFMK
ncbi:MAG: undecaprenyl-diphosphate phosphatase [Candidatus Omnitrophica bacterium]|nr:undecaprenyl-diphosphate phosphatase [Candidatus Omnitrophota bacterium]